MGGTLICLDHAAIGVPHTPLWLVFTSKQLNECVNSEGKVCPINRISISTSVRKFVYIKNGAKFKHRLLL